MNLPEYMQAMVLREPHRPLILEKLPLPKPSPVQVLIQVMACGVCRTDLHITDGELLNPKLPLIPGHEIVGVVVKKGQQVTSLEEGDLVGVP
jgi:propanol-preferring alcohol dehydrogenase